MNLGDSGISKQIVLRIASEYLKKIDALINLSNSILTIIADKMFNIKLSLSILKGGVVDFQQGKIGKDIYDEINQVKESLNTSVVYLRSVKSKVEELGKIEDDSLLLTEFSSTHINKINEFTKSIAKFVYDIKAKVIDKEYDLVEELLNEELKKSSKDYINTWYKTCVRLNNIAFGMVKNQKDNTKIVEKDAEIYRKRLSINNTGVMDTSTKDKPDKKEPPKWVSKASGEKLYFIKPGEENKTDDDDLNDDS